MKFGLPDTTLSAIRNVFAHYKKAEKVILFGSRAKGNFKPGSDIDLAIDGKDLSIDDILALKISLDALHLPYTIDLIKYGSITDADVLEHIQRVGVDIYPHN